MMLHDTAALNAEPGCFCNTPRCVATLADCESSVEWKFTEPGHYRAKLRTAEELSGRGGRCACAWREPVETEQNQHGGRTRQADMQKQGLDGEELHLLLGGIARLLVPAPAH